MQIPRFGSNLLGTSAITGMTQQIYTFFLIAPIASYNCWYKSTFMRLCCVSTIINGQLCSCWIRNTPRVVVARSLYTTRLIYAEINKYTEIKIRMTCALYWETIYSIFLHVMNNNNHSNSNHSSNDNARTTTNNNNNNNNCSNNSRLFYLVC